MKTGGTVRRMIGGLQVEASQIGGGKVGFAIEGDPAKLDELAKGLKARGYTVERFKDEPRTLYAQG